jgi:hypothetical protein
MRGKLAEPNLPGASPYSPKRGATMLGIAKAPREPPAAHLMRDIANAALRSELRDATG